MHADSRLTLASPSPIRKALGWTIALALPLLIAACSTEPRGDGALATDVDHEAHIEWFEGDVEAAFALAAEQGKPLFLYWGAEWCPPCHYLKDKVFKRPEFVEKSRDFLCVYLDGDTERAQILGEELGVMGYPTVIVFSPAGEELMRMPTGVPVERYADVLDAARTAMRPVGEVLAEVMEVGPAAAASSDLYLLAFYSWDQDDKVGLEPAEARATFGRLYRESPAELTLERSRFLTLYLETLAAAADGEEELGLADAALDELRDATLALLDDEDLLKANLIWLNYYSADTVRLFHSGPSPERDALVERWLAAGAALEESTDLAAVDRIACLMPAIRLAELDETEDTEDAATTVSPETQERVRRRAAWAVETVTDEGELQAVMNTLAYLMVSAGLEAEAEELLTSKMDETLAPYYYMSWVGGMKEDAGEIDEALVWYRKAYDTARGRYTRFRWGSMYLRHLLELAPDDAVRIEAESNEILTELLTFDDAFAGGNHSRLEQLDGALVDWNEEGAHQETVDSLRELVAAACSRYPNEGEESQQVRCNAFLADDEEISAL